MEQSSTTQNHIDYSPDVLVEKKTDETLLFEKLPTSSVGSTTYVGGTGLAVAAGDTTEIQYNDGNNTLGADSGLSWNKTTKTLILRG